jgi:hypothetical protein
MDNKQKPQEEWKGWLSSHACVGVFRLHMILWMYHDTSDLCLGVLMWFMLMQLHITLLGKDTF